MNKPKTYKGLPLLTELPLYRRSVPEFYLELEDTIRVKCSTKEPIREGDTYVAERYTNGIQLLTCKGVGGELSAQPYIVPIENAYPFDRNDCIKVVEQELIEN